MSTKAKVPRSSIIRFVEIIEDTLIGSRVEIFDKAAKADVIKHSKFYFFDPGVLNGLLGNFIVSSDRKGHLFEHLIFSQLRNSAMALDKKIEIFYFRTRHGVEVDFVIYWQGKYYAIEVKSGDVDKMDISGLKAFREYFPNLEKSFIVSTKGKRRILEDIIICDVVTLFKELEM